MRPGVTPPGGRERLIDQLLFSMSFMTRLPVSSRIHEAGVPSRIGASSFMLVGLLLGAVLFALAQILGHIPFLSTPLSPYLSALILLLGWVFSTGGLHLDGVADSVEAALAPVSVEEKKRIRKDPHKGSFAMIALNLLLLGKWIGLLLVSPRTVGIFLAPLLSRSLLAFLFQRLGAGLSHRPEGLGALILSGSKGEAIAVAGGGIFAAFLLLGMRGFVVGLFLAGMLLILGKWILRRSDGLSGDLAGFLVETGEVLTLLLVSL